MNKEENTDAFETWWENHSEGWPEQLRNQERFTAACAWQAAMQERVRLACPSEVVVAKKAVDICASIPETVTQGAAKERATRAFYEWFIEQIRIEESNE